MTSLLHLLLVLHFGFLVTTQGQDADCDTFDVICVMDQSGSINSNAWQETKDFCIDVVETFESISPESRFGVVVFSDDARIEVELTSSSGAVIRLLRGSRHTNPRGKTNIADALTVVKDHLLDERRDHARQIVFFVSDGESKPERDIREEAEELKAIATVFAIGVGQAISRTSFQRELRYIATDDTREMTYMFLVDEFDDLSDAIPLDQLSENLCFSSCSYADVVIIMDASGSITHRDNLNWVRLQDFTINIIQSFDVGRDATRVALITFTRDITVEFHLNDLHDSRDMVEHIRQLRNDNRGKTAIADALEVTRRSVLRSSEGDRSNARNIVFLITDGEETERPAADVQDEADRLKQEEDVRLYVIDVKDETQRELRNIASDPEEDHYFRVSDFAALDSSLSELRNLLCPTTPAPTPPTTAVPPVTCTTFDVICVMDRSGSTRNEAWDRTKDFCIEVVETFESTSPDSRYGIVTFSDDARIEVELTSNSGAVIRLLRGSRHTNPRGKTNIADALTVVKDHLLDERRDHARQIVFFVSDGESKPERDIREEAEELKAIATVFAIGVGQAISRTSFQRELRYIATDDTREMTYMFLVDEFDDLSDVIPLRRLSVDLCEIEGCPNLDISFLIDKSGSVGSDGFQTVKDFVVDIIDAMDIAPDKRRVSALSFARTTDFEFSFRDYDRKEQVLEHIKLIEYRGGATNLTGVLQALQESRMRSSSRPRDGVQHLVYLVTDGRANMDDEQLISVITKELKHDGVHIVCITASRDSDMHRLYNMATHPPKDNILDISSFRSRSALVQQAVDISCPSEGTCEASPCSPICEASSYQNVLCDVCSSGVGESCEIDCRHREHDIIILVDVPRQKDIQTAFLLMSRALVSHATPADDLTRVAFITYSYNQAVTHYGYGEYDTRQQLLEATTFYVEDRSADMEQGLQAAQRYSQRYGRGRPQAVVLITDGAADLLRSGPNDRLQRQADVMKDEGIQLYVVGYGSRAREERIQQLATSGRLPYVQELEEDAENAMLISDGIMRNICQR